MNVNNKPEDGHNEGVSYETLEDEELAYAAKDGSKEARNCLFLRHTELIKMLTSRARRRLRGAFYRRRANIILDYEDVYQQSFVVFCELLARWEPGIEPFVNYLRRKMPWRLQDYVRDAMMGRSGNIAQETLPIEADGDNGTQLQSREHPADDPDTLAQWNYHMKSLPATLRPAITLKYYDDLTSAQIACLTGRTRHEVNRSLHNALSILRQELQDTWEDT